MASAMLLLSGSPQRAYSFNVTSLSVLRVTICGRSTRSGTVTGPTITGLDAARAVAAVSDGSALKR